MKGEATKRHIDGLMSRRAARGSGAPAVARRRTRAEARVCAVCACAAGATMAALAGCTQERVVGYRPALLGTLADAHSQTPITLDEGRARPGARDGVNPEGRFDPNLLRSVHDDGTVTLIARRPYHLMVHIYYTLVNGEQDLFTSQVLSQLTKDEYLAHGRDPAEAYETLQQRQGDILRLFAAMPQGELTPGVLMQKVGPDVYRLEAAGSGARSLKWRFMDVTMEHGHWRLRWFGS